MGASRVRDLFVQAKKKAPAILFIDEVDALGKETLNRLITEIDRVDNSSRVIIFVATNQTNYHLGSFTRVVMADREAILKIHIDKRKVPLGDDVDRADIASMTPTFTGAHLANLVN